MRCCYKGGYVVAARYFVPDDPSVAGVQDDVSPTGCSRLSCWSCGAKVRQAPRLRPAKAPRSPAHLWQVADWSKLRSLEPDEHGRLYVCRCAYHVEVNWNLLGDTDSNKLMVPLSWSCSGHPDAAPAKKTLRRRP